MLTFLVLVAFFLLTRFLFTTLEYFVNWKLTTLLAVSTVVASLVLGVVAHYLEQNPLVKAGLIGGASTVLLTAAVCVFLMAPTSLIPWPTLHLLLPPSGSGMSKQEVLNTVQDAIAGAAEAALVFPSPLAPLPIVLTPLINFLLLCALGRFVSWRALAVLVIASMVGTLLYLLSYFPEIVAGIVYTTTLGNWVSSGLFEVNWVFSIDALTYVMLLVVLTVSTLVHLYSTEYMSADPHTTRFISYLSLFTFFMLLLITSDNFIGLFLGWEGVGLCSYLLISFWFTRIQANKAAIKAMVVNRIADLFFTIGILVIFYTFQTVEFNTVFGLTPYLVKSELLFGTFTLSPLTLLAFLLFLGAMGKSAQIGLHTWLPDAMEGPTPVSALIHAATMVTAGVFLIIRCSPIFERVPSVLLFITFIGAATAFMAATAGLLQNDLKKVIAYSTCSQLGYMIFACGLSGYSVSLFHLSNHAFFKALLFLSAGAVIHAISNEQDLRRFGGLLQLLPYTYAMFLIGSLALMGFPFLTGYFSKDLILEMAGAAPAVGATFAHWIGLVTAYFTAFYSFRLLHLTFYGESRSPRAYLAHTHELTPLMAIALAVLAFGGLFIGFIARDLFVGVGATFWNGSIYQAAACSGHQLAGEFLSTTMKMLPLIGSTISVALVFFLYDLYPAQAAALLPANAPARGIYRFLSAKWGFDTVYNRLINQPLLKGAYNITFSLIDKGILEIAGPTGLGYLTLKAGKALTKFQTGRVYDYAAFMVVALYLALMASSLFLDFDPLPAPISLFPLLPLLHAPLLCRGTAYPYSSLLNPPPRLCSPYKSKERGLS
jgi:proton-translocating NADH-quinone oxidoreductase chain L